MWINSLQEASGIITPLLKVRRAGSQYSLMSRSAWSEQMHRREKSECLPVVFGLTALLAALLLLWEEECKPQGERETDGPIPNCRSFVSRLCATYVMRCAGNKQPNQMPKPKPCTPRWCLRTWLLHGVCSGVRGFAEKKKRVELLMLL